jgi:hypothetical protein
MRHLQKFEADFCRHATSSRSPVIGPAYPSFVTNKRLQSGRAARTGEQSLRGLAVVDDPAPSGRPVQWTSQSLHAASIIWCRTSATWIDRTASCGAPAQTRLNLILELTP